MIKQEYVDTMLYELSQMDPYVIGAAYLYAKNYYKFGTDVTEKWTTAVQQTAILERSYNSGVRDTLERLREMEKPKWIPCNERLPEIEQSVLISCRNLDVYKGFRSNTPGYYYVDGKYIDEKDVLAWMPSPKAYVISSVTEKMFRSETSNE